MKNLELIQTLRRQAVDDEIGVICCRPPEQVRVYLHLALDLAAPPAPVRELVAKLEALLAEPSYDAGCRLFDLVEEWARTGKAQASALRILSEAGRQAVREGATARLEQVLALHADCVRLWPEGWTDFLPDLARELRIAHALPDQTRAACRLALLAAWEKEGLPPPWGPAVLQAIRRQLGQPAPVADTAAELLERLRDPARLADTWTAAWRRALAQSDGQVQILAPALEESKSLLPLLQAEANYAGLYQAAVQSVAHSSQDCSGALLDMLVARHPTPEGLASLLSLRAALGGTWDVDAWRAFACALCRESDTTQRLSLARTEVARVLSAQLRAQPAAWSTTVAAVARILPDGFPDAALRARWMAEAAAFPDLTAAHVRALGELSGPAAAAAARPWCELGELLGDRLRAADRRAWFGIALDLLAASLSWDPAALAETVARWRGFVQSLLLAQSGYAAEANRIMACQRETLDGPLFDACAARRPGKSVQELDALKACGLGLGRG